MAAQAGPEQQVGANDALRIAAERARVYVEGIGERSVAPARSSVAALSRFREPFPGEPCDPSEVVRLLDEIGSPATMATTGRRYFGFVIGGALPASMAASWLANSWDQNVALRVMSPTAAELEEVALRWVGEILGLPKDCAGGLVTYATMANFTALTAARHALLARAGWNVEHDGMFGSPPIEVVVGAEVHMSIEKALSLAGFGSKRVVTVETDAGTWEATVLVAADGLASPLRAAEGLDVASSGPRRYGLRQHVRLRPWTDCVEVHLSKGLEAYVTPAGAERVGVAFLWEDGRVPPQISWPALVQRFPALAARLQAAVPDSTPRGAGPLRRRVLTRVRPGFVLLGDAAGYVDAITGEGLSLALVGAEALAACLPEAVFRRGEPSAFRPYLATCRREYRRYALVAGSVLWLARHPTMRRSVLAALGLSPDAFSWLLAHTVA